LSVQQAQNVQVPLLLKLSPVLTEPIRPLVRRRVQLVNLVSNALVLAPHHVNRARTRWRAKPAALTVLQVLTVRMQLSSPNLVVKAISQLATLSYVQHVPLVFHV
jgi:hypothetical protein